MECYSVSLTDTSTSVASGHAWSTWAANSSILTSKVLSESSHETIIVTNSLSNLVTTTTCTNATMLEATSSIDTQIVAQASSYASTLIEGTTVSSTKIASAPAPISTFLGNMSSLLPTYTSTQSTNGSPFYSDAIIEERSAVRNWIYWIYLGLIILRQR